MCAKIGGEPWAIDKLPFLDTEPTMVCGMDVYTNTSGKGAKPILAFCASMNPRATTFWSAARE